MSFYDGYGEFYRLNCLFRNNSLASQSTAGTDAFFDPEIVETHIAGDTALLDISLLGFEDEFDAHYGLLAPEQTVIIRAYSDDSDDQVLSEIQPKFIIMFEPNQDFVRRVEVEAFLLWRRLTY